MAPAAKKQHTFLTIDQKKEVLKKLSEGQPIRQLAAPYNVGKSTISDIKSSGLKIDSYIARTECGLGKRKTMRPAEFEKMEDHLYKWFVNARRNNAPISSEIIQEKAKQCCSQIYGQSVEFVASNGWFSNFRSRYGIKFLRISGEKLSNDSTAVQPFIEKLRKKIAEMGITYNQVYNADETDVAFLSSNSWKNVDERVLRKCFNKILYDEEWDSDDDLPLAMLRPSSSTKIIDLLVEISPDVYNDNEITEWLNDDTDFDINEIGEEDNENSSLDENESQDPKISHSQAIVAFDSCIKYAEEQEFSSGDILKLVSLRDIAFRKRNETKLRQTNILNYFTAE
ncbi:jerky protein homolog-like [Anastrepha obliqua]|uniref:jerky protein homolog-like n=1 Tax=Anastrepha obliqua TaxID=95512 RepID=UPI002409A5D4|nr:jerky protein homolog-like [Anastrepha obliqua]